MSVIVAVHNGYFRLRSEVKSNLVQLHEFRGGFREAKLNFIRVGK